MQRRFAWYELMTTDPGAAKDFYTKLIGWGLQTFEVPGQDASVHGEPYVMWTRGGQPVGGVMRLPAQAQQMGAPPHWLAYVGVPDVEATTEQAVKLGARVLVPPSPIPDGGRFAVISDPQGAVFGLASAPSGQAEPTPADLQPGDFSWHELATTDQKAAFDFYRALFEWDKGEATDMGEMGVYQVYGSKDRPLGGIFTKPANMPGPPHWLLYVLVSNVDELAGKVKALGGRILFGPVDVPGGDRIVNCLDPQGAAFALHQRKAAG